MRTNRNAEDSVLSANKTRLDNLDRAIKEANERRRRLVEKASYLPTIRSRSFTVWRDRN